MYDYNAFAAMPEHGAGVAGVFLAVYGVLMLASCGFSILSYVLQSLGSYTIAKRRGIRHPWLAWLPVGDAWIWGSIADQYQYVAKGRVKNRRKILLALNIVIGVLALMMIGMYVGTMVNLIVNAGQLEYMNDTMVMHTVFPPLLGMLLMVFPMVAMSITNTVFLYISLYDVFASCDPNNSTLYLVLSILLSVTRPFFLFACRNKDLGMPPRRPAFPTQPE